MRVLIESYGGKPINTRIVDRDTNELIHPDHIWFDWDIYSKELILFMNVAEKEKISELVRFTGKFEVVRIDDFDIVVRPPSVKQNAES